MSPPTRPRAAWGSLTREQVVSAAERMVRAGGYEQLTIRNLAAALEVAPMSLYRHVRDKDDLLDEVVDRMLARRWRPKANRDDWASWTTEACERFRDFLLKEPAALHIYLRHPVVSPNAVQRRTTVLEVLRDAGFDQEAAERAYAAVHTYTIGFAALEASRARAAREDAIAAEESALRRQLASFTTTRQFREGLAYLIEGIDRHRSGTSR